MEHHAANVPTPHVTTGDLIDAVGSELRHYLTTGKREENFDCTPGRKPERKKTHIAMSRPRSAAGTSASSSKSLARSSSTQSLSSTSSYASDAAESKHARDVRRRLEDQVVGGGSKSQSNFSTSTPRSRSSQSMASSQRQSGRSAISSTSSHRSTSTRQSSSQSSQHRRTGSTPSHKLTGGEAHRLMSLATKLIVATETVAMVPTPEKSTKLRHSSVPSSIQQLRRGTEKLEQKLKRHRQLSARDMDRSSSSLALDDLQASGSEISVAESVDLMHTQRETPRSSKHKQRPHTAKQSSGGKSYPTVNVSPPSSTVSLDQRQASASQSSLKQRKGGSDLMSRSDTTLVYSRNRATRQDDSQLHARLKDSPYKARMNLSSGYGVSSTSSLRAGPGTVNRSRQSMAGDGSYALPPSAHGSGQPRYMVDMATQTVEDKATQTDSLADASSPQSPELTYTDLSGTRREVESRSHPLSTADVSTQAVHFTSSSSQLANEDGQAHSTSSTSVEMSTKAPKKSHALLMKEAEAMLEKLQALVQYDVEVYTGSFVPLFAADNQLLITLCGTERESEEQPLETDDDGAPELETNTKHTFRLHCEDVGSVKSIRFKHTSGDGWLPEKVVVRRQPDQVSFIFNFSGESGTSARNSTAALASAEVAESRGVFEVNQQQHHHHHQQQQQQQQHYSAMPNHQQLYAPQQPVAGPGNQHPAYMPVLQQVGAQQPYLYPHPPFPNQPFVLPSGPAAPMHAPGQYMPQSGQVVMTPSGPMTWLPTAEQPQQAVANIGLSPQSVAGSTGASPLAGTALQQHGQIPRQMSIGLESLVSGQTGQDAGNSEDKQSIDKFLDGFRVGVEAGKRKSSGGSVAVDDQEASMTQRQLASPEGDSIHEAANKSNVSRLRDLLDKSTHWLSVADENGLLPIHCAASHGQLDSLKILSSYEVDLEATTSTGYTALHCAAMHGHVRCMKLLGALGCSINSRSIDRQTPLHLAAANGHLECCKWLIANRAKLKMKDSNGRKPKKIARENGHAVVADFLESCQEEAARAGSALSLLRTPNSVAASITNGGKLSKRQSVSYWQSDNDSVAESDRIETSPTENSRQRRKGHHHLGKHTEEQQQQQHYEKHQERMTASNQSFLDAVRQEAEEAQ